MRFRPQFGRLLCAAVVLFTASAIATAAPIAVNATVTSLGSLFHYEYSITNNTLDDVFIIDVTTPKSLTAVTDLKAPMGFQIAFDSGLGLVSFIEDSSHFAAIPTLGFSFDSPFAPVASVFNATVVNGTSVVYNLTGPTESPAAVPEPGTAPILAILALALPVLLRRRRNASNSSDVIQAN